MDCIHPLRAFRESHTPPLSLQALADLVGTTKVTVWRWETGARKISDTILPEIVKKTGISAAQLRPDLVELLRAAE